MRLTGKPALGAFAQRDSRFVDAHDRRGDHGWVRARAYEPVDALLDQLDRRVVGTRHDDAGGRARGGLDDDHAVALPRRGRQQAQGATHLRVDGLGRGESRGRDDLADAVPGNRLAYGLALWPVAEDHAPQPLDPASSERDRGHRQRGLLLGDQARRKQHDVLRVRGRERLDGPGVQAAQHRHLPTQPLLSQPQGVQSREAERVLAHARAGALHEPADAPADAAEVLAPVDVAPDLEPVDLELVASQRTDQRGGEQREVGESARTHDVVTATVHKQVHEHPHPEHERRQDPPPAAGRV